RDREGGDNAGARTDRGHGPWWSACARLPPGVHTGPAAVRCRRTVRTDPSRLRQRLRRVGTVAPGVPVWKLQGCDPEGGRGVRSYQLSAISYQLSAAGG